MQPFYLTTPIYYVNAEPHLGHAYTTCLADVATRYARLLGRQARLQTGTDEHGDKIAQAAAMEGVEPKAYATRISDKFRAIWPDLAIEPDHFIRTTDPEHIQTVQTILQKVYDQGDIYAAKYGGNYCFGCERFLTDREVVDGRCPEHDAPTTFIEEDNYFFRMSKYQDQLKAHIEANPEFIRPERYRNEVLAMLAEPLDDLCISRPKSRLTWGIELPFDEGFVTYVWFDALINYLTGLDWPDGELYGRFWPAAQHLIAKDILKPHAIYWPTMLLAAGIPLYQHLNVHGYWNVDSAKMSKSLGNVVRPLDLAGVYGVDAFRYFLMREMSFGLDAAFSESALVGRYNADLANDLGNLFSRVLNMLHRYRDGVVPPLHEEALTPVDAEMRATLGGRHHAKARQELEAKIGRFDFAGVLFDLWQVISAANKYVVQNQPWELVKDEAKAANLDNVLHVLCQVLASVAQLIWPVMPATAQKMAAGLGLQLSVPADWDAALDLRLLQPGTATAAPEALFPRVDTDQVKAKAAKEQAKKEKPAKGKPKKAKKSAAPPPEITIDDFAKVELKLGQVVSVEPVEGADKLLKLMVDLGEDEPRQIVSGIAQHYAPDELTGRQVVVVANLKPVKLRGVESRGMILAASTKEKVRVLGPDTTLPPGSKVS